MRTLRRTLIRFLAGRWAVVLNTDINFAGPGCHLEAHGARHTGRGYMYLENSHFVELR